MKAPVAMTIIVTGTLLLLAPAGADYLYQRNVVALRTQAPGAEVKLIERLNNWYRFGCWFPGSLMIILGVISSIAVARAGYYADDDEEDQDEDEESNE